MQDQFKDAISQAGGELQKIVSDPIADGIVFEVVLEDSIVEVFLSYEVVETNPELAMLLLVSKVQRSSNSLPNTLLGFPVVYTNSLPVINDQDFEE